MRNRSTLSVTSPPFKCIEVSWKMYELQKNAFRQWVIIFSIRFNTTEFIFAYPLGHCCVYMNVCCSRLQIVWKRGRKESNLNNELSSYFFLLITCFWIESCWRGGRSIYRGKGVHPSFLATMMKWTLAKGWAFGVVLLSFVVCWSYIHTKKCIVLFMALNLKAHIHKQKDYYQLRCMRRIARSKQISMQCIVRYSNIGANNWIY